MNDEANKAAARAYVEASCAHSLALIRPLLHEDVIYQSANVGDFQGREAALEMMSGFFAQFPDVHWDVQAYRTVDANTVSFEFVLTATNSTTGERFERDAVESIEFNDDCSIRRIIVG